MEHERNASFDYSYHKLLCLDNLVRLNYNYTVNN